jgi:hypothetical protein
MDAWREEGQCYVQTDNEIRAVLSYDLAAGAWGNGVLSYDGKEYRFGISSLSIGDMDTSTIELSGEVLNLENLEDFNGSYASFDASTVGGFGGGTRMRNQNGVIIEIVATNPELAFGLGVGSMKIELRST